MGIRKKFLTSSQQIACCIMRLKKIYLNEKYTGPGSVLQLADIMRNDGSVRVLIVTDQKLADLGLTKSFENRLTEYGIDYVVFSELNNKVNLQSFEKGWKLYSSSDCDTVMAIGGGTVIDCAKLIALKAGNPSRSISYFMDFTATPRKAVPLYAAPTTPGTGSEVSLFSFYTDSKGRKCPVVSSEFVPRAVALDPDFLKTLSPEMIACCGMSTLTRAIEAYISTYSERFFRDTSVNAPKACRMVFENLYDAFIDPDNINARMNLMKASYYAGIAFRRSSGGYIEAISNTVSELYGIHHGKADAVLLPVILEYYMPEINSDLAAIAYQCDFTDDRCRETENAFRLVEQIKDLNQMLGFPDHIREIEDTDIELIVKRSQADARLCGCPKIFTDQELETILFDFSYKKNAG